MAASKLHWALGGCCPAFGAIAMKVWPPKVTASFTA
jgi:hypothetical protein